MNQEEVWTKFLRWKLVPQQFPREITLGRAVVLSLHQYLEYLHRGYLGACYTSVFGKKQIEKNIIDTVYSEIDAPTIGFATTSAAYLEEALVERGLVFRKYFSACRGFHYYLDFKPIQLQQPGLATRKFLESLPAVIDTNCMGRLRQMGRIPYTKHQKTGLFMFRVIDKFSFQEAINPKLVELPIQVNDDLPNILQSFDEVVVRQKNIVEESIVSSTSLDYLPACIVYALDELASSHHLSHPQRLHLGAFLLKVGWTEDLVVDVFREALDFKENYTMTQVKYLKKAEFNCYGCRKAFANGICPPDIKRGERQCRFYPNINKHIR